MAYCIRAPGYTRPDTTTSPPTPTPTSSPSSSSSTGVKPPGPTHTGQPTNCNKWHVVVSGDTCTSVAADAGIMLAQFLAWNPAVSADCTQNFWVGSAYCVGVSGQGVPSTTGKATGSTTTSKAATTTRPGVVVPSPVQEGNAVEGCNKYAQAQAGDWCSKFAVRNKVALVDLYRWNRVLGADGSGCETQFWAGYWYCVGVA